MSGQMEAEVMSGDHTGGLTLYRDRPQISSEGWAVTIGSLKLGSQYLTLTYLCHPRVLGKQ